jgi:energy-coupling factor transport system ATP-binding protein
MILLEDVSFSYPPNNKLIFTNLSVRVESQTWSAIAGPDGSGKTTLAKLVEGRLTPDGGRTAISVDSQAGGVGYLGGDPYDTIVGICVEEDIVFGLENLGFEPEQIERRLRRALQWTGLDGMEDRLVHTLSGGEQQKVALASALAAGTRILILDEALSMLDRPTRHAIRQLIGRLQRQKGLTVIEITHCLEDILSAERILFLSEAGIGFDGDAGEFLQSTFGRRWVEFSGGASALTVELFRRGLVPSADMSPETMVSFLTSNIRK